MCTSWSGFNMTTLNKAYCIVLYCIVLYCIGGKMTLIISTSWGYLSIEHKYKDRSKLGNFALA